MARTCKLSETVSGLLLDWAMGEIDQDGFDEALDELAEYNNDVHSSVDSYLAGIA